MKVSETPHLNNSQEQGKQGLGDTSADIPEFVLKKRYVWQLKRGKRVFMPLSTTRVRRWISEGRVSESDLVWRSGFAAWRKVGECEEFKGSFKKKASE